MRRPVQFSPVCSGVDYTRGQAEGHYRRLNQNVVSRNEQDSREPLWSAEFAAVENPDCRWHLCFRETKSGFVTLFTEAIGYLDAHRTEFMHQFGSARNSGGETVDCELVNPL